jgi:hypothetical protein
MLAGHIGTGSGVNHDFFRLPRQIGNRARDVRVGGRDQNVHLIFFEQLARGLDTRIVFVRALFDDDLHRASSNVALAFHRVFESERKTVF